MHSSLRRASPSRAATTGWRSTMRTRRAPFRARTNESWPSPAVRSQTTAPFPFPFPVRVRVCVPSRVCVCLPSRASMPFRGPTALTSRSDVPEAPAALFPAGLPEGGQRSTKKADDDDDGLVLLRLRLDRCCFRDEDDDDDDESKGSMASAKVDSFVPQSYGISISAWVNGSPRRSLASAAERKGMPSVVATFLASSRNENEDEDENESP
mmetsp:Transcript_5099/g.14793  ORF Transcript_5099/g.14793 Transcript_5099/m.14793 type:complete len:210 (-) Transcript_5099:410-1039(-)